jgi:molybdate transport system regulatory protein
MKVSARNQLKGTVKSLTQGSINCDVVIEVAPGIEITAQITSASAASLGLKPGATAYALIKADSVMIGVEH